MSDSIWRVPEQRLDAAAARRTILIQHGRIRELLAHAQQIAERALDQEPLPLDAVASAIGDIHATFEVHLTFEERVLVAIFEDDMPVGPLRAARLREEHARQRATLAGLHAEARAAPQLPILAAKLAFLASWLLEDMNEEESTVLAPESLRDGIVVTDQSDG